MHFLLAGPDFSKAPPKPLHSALGWYAMEKYDYTLYSFIEGRHGTSPTTDASLAGGLAGLLISARKQGFVHADLHAETIGIQKQSGVVEAMPKRRLYKKSPDDSTKKQTAVVRFADCSRS